MTDAHNADCGRITDFVTLGDIGRCHASSFRNLDLVFQTVLQPDKQTKYASRKSFGSVILVDSGSCPRCRQHSGLGGWLDLSI